MAATTLSARLWRPQCESLKTFTLHIPDLGETHELTIEGARTIEDLRVMATQIASRALGPGVRPRLLGLPKGHPDLQLGELKLKAPHRVVLMRSPAHGGEVASDSWMAAAPSSGPPHLRQDTRELAELVREKIDAGEAPRSRTQLPGRVFAPRTADLIRPLHTPVRLCRVPSLTCLPLRRAPVHPARRGRGPRVLVR
jgi:hypothetical protein